MNLYFDKKGNEVNTDCDYYWKIEFDYDSRCTYVIVYRGKFHPSLVGAYLYNHSEKKKAVAKNRNKLKSILPKKVWVRLISEIFSEAL